MLLHYKILIRSAMPDNLSPTDRRRTMQAVKSKRTSLERRLHSMLAARHTKGWHLNDAHLPGKPDIVFSEERLVIFVDGCFWHGCPYCNRIMPETNRDYWQRKIRRNRDRDIRNTLELEGLGWMVLRIWEHELSNSESAHVALERIMIALAQRKVC